MAAMTTMIAPFKPAKECNDRDVIHLKGFAARLDFQDAAHKETFSANFAQRGGRVEEREEGAAPERAAPGPQRRAARGRAHAPPWRGRPRDRMKKRRKQWLSRLKSCNGLKFS
mgnify:CR=1 FL=1